MLPRRSARPQAQRHRADCRDIGGNASAAKRPGSPQPHRTRQLTGPPRATPQSRRQTIGGAAVRGTAPLAILSTPRARSVPAAPCTPVISARHCERIAAYPPRSPGPGSALPDPPFRTFPRRPSVTARTAATFPVHAITLVAPTRKPAAARKSARSWPDHQPRGRPHRAARPSRPRTPEAPRCAMLHPPRCSRRAIFASGSPAPEWIAAAIMASSPQPSSIRVSTPIRARKAASWLTSISAPS